MDTRSLSGVAGKSTHLSKDPGVLNVEGVNIIAFCMDYVSAK